MTSGNEIRNVLMSAGPVSGPVDFNRVWAIAPRKKTNEERELERETLKKRITKQNEALNELKEALTKLGDKCCPSSPEPDIGDGSFRAVQRLHYQWERYYESEEGKLADTLRTAICGVGHLLESNRYELERLWEEELRPIADAKSIKYGDDGAPLAAS